MNLYEITELQKELEREEDAEIKQDLQELIATELKNKSNNITYVIKNLEAHNTAIDAEIERLQQLKNRNSGNIDKIKSNIIWFMQENKVDSIKSDLATYSIRKSESTDIENMDLIPTEFITIKQTITPDKTAIKKAIKEGRKVTGAKVVVNYNLQIK